MPFFLNVFHVNLCSFYSISSQAIDDYIPGAAAPEDLPQALHLLGEMNTNVIQVTDLVESMLQKVKTGELTTEYGLSFLEVKYHMLLTYLINLTYVVLRKCSGKFFFTYSYNVFNLNIRFLICCELKN